MKLEQNQIWKTGAEYLRIVQLERLEVGYKAMRDLISGHGPHHHVSKKEFCRLLKSASLLTDADVRKIRDEERDAAALQAAAALSSTGPGEPTENVVREQSPENPER